MAELRVDLGNVDGTVADTGRSGGGPRRLRLREVTHPERMRFDPVLDASNPCGPFAHGSSKVAGRDDHRRGAVRDRRDVGVA